MEAKDHEGLVNLEPRGMFGMIYVRDHQTLLYTISKYISCGPYGYGKVFPIICLCELLIPLCMTSFHSRGLIGQNLCRGPLDILNIYKYIKYNLMVLEIFPL